MRHTLCSPSCSSLFNGASKITISYSIYAVVLRWCKYLLPPLLSSCLSHSHLCKTTRLSPFTTQTSSAPWQVTCINLASVNTLTWQRPRRVTCSHYPVWPVVVPPLLKPHKSCWPNSLGFPFAGNEDVSAVLVWCIDFNVLMSTHLLGVARSWPL